MFVMIERKKMKRYICKDDDCGAEGDRTLGLVNAIHALSQLSYSP